MSVNKFGLPLKSDSFIRQSYDSRNIDYVRNNTLCLNNSGNDSYYDAKSYKISRLSLPNLDTDAANKQYVDKTVQSVRYENNSITKDLEEKIKDLNKRIENKFEENQTDLRILQDQYMKKIYEDWILNIYNKIERFDEDLSKIKDILEDHFQQLRENNE